jgi:hypothetical protein
MGFDQSPSPWKCLPRVSEIRRRLSRRYVTDKTTSQISMIKERFKWTLTEKAIAIMESMFMT